MKVKVWKLQFKQKHPILIFPDIITHRRQSTPKNGKQWVAPNPNFKIIFENVCFETVNEYPNHQQQTWVKSESKHKLFIQEIAFWKLVCIMSAILFRPRYIMTTEYWFRADNPYCDNLHKTYRHNFRISPGARPNKELPLEFKFDWNVFVYIFSHIILTTTQICTYQDSCAVLLCANLRYDRTRYLCTIITIYYEIRNYSIEYC